MISEKMFTRNSLYCTLTYFFLIVLFFLFYVDVPAYATERFAALERGAGLIASIFFAGDIVARLTVNQHIEQSGNRRVVLVIYISIHTVLACCARQRC